MKRYLFVLLLCSLLGARSLAQPLEILTFEEALHRMDTRNERIAAADYESEAAWLQKKAAFGLRLPQVGVTGAYAYMQDDVSIDFNNLKTPLGTALGEFAEAFPDLGGALGGWIDPAFQRSWEYRLLRRDLGTVGATLQMPVYTGGKINAANNAARIDWDIALEKGEQTRNELVSELVERYFGLSLANQVENVRKEVLEGMQKYLEDAIELENNGMIARVERLYAEMSVAEARREYQKAVRDVQTINTALANTLNQEGSYLPATSLFLVEDLESVDFFKELALDRNPQLRQVGLMEQKAREGVRAQRAEFMPQVAVLGGYSLYKYHMTDLLPTWIVGAGVQIKLFDGLNREYKYGAAKRQVKQVEALAYKAGSDVQTLIEKLYNEMLSSAEQIGSLDVALEFAEEYLRAKDTAFQGGMAPSSDVVDASLNLAKIRTERLQAAYQYDLLLAQLLEACGDSHSNPVYLSGHSVLPIRFEK